MRRRCAQNAGGCPYRCLGAGPGDFLLQFRSPGRQKRKGGFTMTFEQVVLLLSLIGGAVYVTFQITWTVSHSDEQKKK